jgi:hypothetical protein
MGSLQQSSMTVSLLELTIYKGSKKNGAKSLFGLNVGENIYIEFF